MIILGIDPGIATTGYGVIEYTNSRFRYLDSGVITTKSGQRVEKRLLCVYDSVMLLINKYSPQSLAVEELFFNSNQKTAVNVCQARGTILLAAEKSGISVFEYTPLQVKQAVVGYGRAEKRQVMEMVRMILKLNEVPRPDDAADALAIAVCHAHCGASRLGNLNMLAASRKTGGR